MKKLGIVVAIWFLAGGMSYLLLWPKDSVDEPELISIYDLQNLESTSVPDSQSKLEGDLVVTTPEFPASPDQAEEETNIAAGFDMTRFHQLKAVTSTEGEER